MRALCVITRPGMGARICMIGLITLCTLGALRVAEGALIPAKAVVAQVLLERAFENSLADHRPHKPWPWADMAPIARFSVPRLGIGRIVLDSGSGQAMAFGPALLPGTATPSETGTAVITVHRDTHFQFLEHVRIGDHVIVEDRAGRRHEYQVAAARVVRWDQFALPMNDDAQRVALTTCWPFDAQHAGPLRYVVTAMRIDNTGATDGRAGGRAG